MDLRVMESVLRCGDTHSARARAAAHARAGENPTLAARAMSSTLVSISQKSHGCGRSRGAVRVSHEFERKSSNGIADPPASLRCRSMRKFRLSAARTREALAALLELENARVHASTFKQLFTRSGTASTRFHAWWIGSSLRRVTHSHAMCERRQGRHAFDVAFRDGRVSGR